MHTNTAAIVPSVSSIFLPVGEQRLHLKRFCGSARGEAVVMVHGSIENGQIFYSDSGKGLAPWLAARGYDVFVADLRGRGQSQPEVSAASDWGLREILQEDFPAMLQHISSLKGNQPQHWLGHSWGGVLLLAYLARWPAPAPVASLCFFGTKRRIGVWNPKKALMIDLAWASLGGMLTRLYGYLPAKKWNMGSDNESARSYRETHRWIVAPDWRDPLDGFDYRAALQKQALPPALYITGQSDSVLGNPIDVHRLMQETGSDQINRLIVAGKHMGFKHDYGHIDLLTHADAPIDVYPTVAAWLQQYGLRR
jgi:predicted alpha/beta hydrolase